RIKTAGGVTWLTVPVHGSPKVPISDIRIDDTQPWRRRHWRTIEHAYRRAPGFDRVAPWLAPILLDREPFLAPLSIRFIEECCRFLGITTPLLRGGALGLEARYRSAPLSRRDATERVIFLLDTFGADTFLSGARGRTIYDAARIEAAGFRILFQDYRHPVYPQRFGPFLPYLSVVDLLMNCGAGSREILLGQRQGEGADRESNPRVRSPEGSPRENPRNPL
ncbi:MAG: hypothetical protein D6795_09410, partial [Deltaproteobacteria bacterium]